MGRNLQPASHRRTNAINVDLTERERAALDSELQRHGLGLSDYIRRLIVAAHQGRFTPPLSTFELFNRTPTAPPPATP